MTLPGLSISRHVFAFMLSALIVLFGIIAYRDIGVDLHPQVDFPMISVSTTLPGKPLWAAWPRTRASWFDSSTTSRTPVTATEVCATSRSRYRSSRVSTGRGSGRETVDFGVSARRKCNGRNGRAASR